MKIERKPVTSDCADPPSPTRVTELPSELPLGRYFSSEEELERVLEELGLSDCRVQLDEQGIAIMPGPFHHRATRFLREEFDVWSKGTWGKWGKSDSDNIQLVQTQNGTTRKREPDVAFWSYKKCTLNEYNTYVVKEIPGSEYDPDPDVVINSVGRESGITKWPP